MWGRSWWSLSESPGPAHGWCGLEKTWVGVRRLAAANCRQTFQLRRGILRGSTVEMIGFWDPTSPTCGLLPSLSPVTDSLAPRLVDRQLPPIPIPLPQTWTWVLEPTQTIRGNKVGPSPARPFLFPSTTLTLHTGAPLFSVQAELGRLWQAMPAKAWNNGPWKKIYMHKQCQLVSDLKYQCFFLCFPSYSHLLMVLS